MERLGREVNIPSFQSIDDAKPLRRHFTLLIGRIDADLFRNARTDLLNLDENSLKREIRRSFPVNSYRKMNCSVRHESEYPSAER